MATRTVNPIVSFGDVTSIAKDRLMDAIGSDTRVFSFDGYDVRVTTDDNGEPWFSANAVCAALGYRNPHQALASHVHDDDLQKLEVIDSHGRTQLANHVKESGVYALILGGSKDEAKL